MLRKPKLNRSLAKLGDSKSEKGIIIHNLEELVSIIVHNIEKIPQGERGIIIHDLTELVGIIVHNYEKMPKGEHGIIIHNLTELAGIIIHNTPKNDFTAAFKSDPVNAIKSANLDMKR